MSMSRAPAYLATASARRQAKVDERRSRIGERQEKRALSRAA